MGRPNGRNLTGQRYDRHCRGHPSGRPLRPIVGLLLQCAPGDCCSAAASGGALSAVLDRAVGHHLSGFARVGHACPDCAD